MLYNHSSVLKLIFSSLNASINLVIIIDLNTIELLYYSSKHMKYIYKFTGIKADKLIVLLYYVSSFIWRYARQSEVTAKTINTFE